jgi:hypothetical protein
MLNIIKFKSVLFYLLPLFYISGPFLSDLSIVLIGVIFIFISFKEKIFINYILSKFSIFFLIFYLILILSSLFSENFLESFSQILFYFRYLFFSLGVYFLFLNGHLNFKILFYSYFIAIFIICFDIFFEYFFGFSLSLSKTNHDLTHRLSSFFGDELVAGSFISRFLPIFISVYILFFKENANKYFIIIFTLFAFCASFLTGERTGFALSIITLICTLIYVKVSLKEYLFIFSFLTILFVIVSIISHKPFERMFNKTFTQLQERSVIKVLPLSKHHEAHALSALKMFKDDPLTGKGPNSFRFLCDDIRFHVDLGCTTHPHNMYIQLLSETGVFGFTYIFLLFLFILKKLTLSMINNLKTNKQNYYYHSEFFLLLAILINLFPLVPSNNFFNNWINILYFLPISLYLGILELKNE